MHYALHINAAAVLDRKILTILSICAVLNLIGFICPRLKNNNLNQNNAYNHQIFFDLLSASASFRLCRSFSFYVKVYVRHQPSRQVTAIVAKIFSLIKLFTGRLVFMGIMCN